MLLLSGNNLKKEFSGETLFEDVSFNVYSNDKIGFIGVNGVGKSTLFKMITGSMDYESGEITKNREIKIGYLEQHMIPDGDITVMDEMLKVYQEVISIEKELDDILIKMENPKNNLDELILRQADLQEKFFALDGMSYKSKLKSALLGLGFNESDFDTPLCKLSGGQKTRIALLKILLSDANLLLLDEPTNHLDIDSIKWLEDFLLNYNGAYIVISHDRYFLDKVTTKTFEIDNKKFRTFDGNHTHYKAQREIEMLATKRNYEESTKEIHRLEEVVEQQRRWKHKKNKKTHTMDNTKKMIERIEKNLVEPDKKHDTMHFKFKACDGGANNVLIGENLSLRFGENQLFENVDINIQKGEKVFILGPNGCGKTSLIKIFMGIYEQTSGKYKIGENIHIGYYDQLKENLNRDKTVINEVWDENPKLTQTEIRNALALFLFKGEDVFKQVKSLSGGELARLELTKLLLKSVNFIIMDEPTNHLDIEACESLERALTGYDGTMLMVSHDRYFINKLADKILYLTPNGIIEYEGNYDDYISKRQDNKIEKKKEKIEIKSNNNKDKKEMEEQKRKNRNRLSKVERLIESTENKINNLKKEYENPEISSDYEKLYEISRQIDLLNKELENYMKEWEVLQQEIDEL